jgi:hypothetical protein
VVDKSPRRNSRRHGHPADDGKHACIAADKGACANPFVISRNFPRAGVADRRACDAHPRASAPPTPSAHGSCGRRCAGKARAI